MHGPTKMQKRAHLSTEAFGWRFPTLVNILTPSSPGVMPEPLPTNTDALKGAGCVDTPLSHRVARTPAAGGALIDIGAGRPSGFVSGRALGSASAGAVVQLATSSTTDLFTPE